MKTMLLLPYQRFTIRTTLQADEVRRKLKKVVGAKQYLRMWGTSHKPYVGEVKQDSFQVNRVIYYRNSFLPVIRGEIYPEIDGCSIEITMHPHMFAIIFMVVWLLAAGSSMLAFGWPKLETWVQSGFLASAYTPSDLVFASMAFCLFFGLLLGFNFEAAKSKSFFRELFKKDSKEDPR